MKLFKKRILVSGLLSLLISSPLLAQKSQYIGGETVPTRVKQRQIITECGYIKPIRVGGFVTNPPFGWVTMYKDSTRNGKMVYVNNGYAFDLFKKISDKLNLNVENVGYKSYQTALRDLRKGKIDVVAGVYYNKNILGVGVNLLFPSFMDNPIVPIFVKGKEKQIATFEDLKGLKGIVRQEELIYPLIYQQLIPGTDLKQVSGSKKAFEMLLRGQVDYMLTSLYAGEAEVRRFKLVDQITFSTTALINPKLFFAFASSTDCQKLKKMYKAEIEKMQKNQQAYKQSFISYIDQWGQTFKDEMGLIEQVRERETPSVSNSLNDKINDNKNGISIDNKETAK